MIGGVALLSAYPVYSRHLMIGGFALLSAYLVYSRHLVIGEFALLPAYPVYSRHLVIPDGSWEQRGDSKFTVPGTLVCSPVPLQVLPEPPPLTPPDAATALEVSRSESPHAPPPVLTS